MAGIPKISIIVSVYQSYEIVRRQLIHLRRITKDLPVEIIIVDDGSNPPIPEASYQTGNKLAWTQGLGRNLGASKAKGEYLLMTDIDHIISKEAIEDALSFTGNKMIFRRQIGVLDENGNLSQDPKVLDDWGWRGKLDASVHGNTWVMKKSMFDELGGYDTAVCNRGYHPISREGDDNYFNTEWNHANRGVKQVYGRDIYLFPLGRFNKTGDLNPFNLFHNLSQTKQEKFYK
jgi:glycosyltransferase involved in cell wall biosynthesis